MRIVHCEEMVRHESLVTLRQKKDSSIRVAMDLHKRGEVDVRDAGNTGAAMATAKFVLKSIPKIDRPPSLPLCRAHNAIALRDSRHWR